MGGVGDTTEEWSGGGPDDDEPDGKGDSTQAALLKYQR